VPAPAVVGMWSIQLTGNAFNPDITINGVPQAANPVYGFWDINAAHTGFDAAGNPVSRTVAWQPGDICLFFLGTPTGYNPSWVLPGTTAELNHLVAAGPRFNIWSRALQSGDGVFTTSNQAQVTALFAQPRYTVAAVIVRYAQLPTEHVSGVSSAATTDGYTPLFSDSFLVGWFDSKTSDLAGKQLATPWQGSVYNAGAANYAHNTDAIGIMTVGAPAALTFGMTPAASGVFVGTVVLPSLNRAPYAPILVSPATGATVDMAAAGAKVVWQPSDPDGPGDPQTAFRLKRLKSGGSNEWWTGSAWTGSETNVVSTSTSVTFGAGLWDNGSSYQWYVATRDSGDPELWGPYSSAGLSAGVLELFATGGPPTGRLRGEAVHGVQHDVADA
jgi:hypothetical protein